MESSLLASSLRMAEVWNVRRGATAVAARKLTPARAAVLRVVRAKRDMVMDVCGWVRLVGWYVVVVEGVDVVEDGRKEVGVVWSK